jgi:nucleotide-binding universal stress UspA family protein
MSVDPFTDERGLGADKIVRAVKALLKNRPAQVELFYVMTPSGVGVPLEKFPVYKDYYRTIAQDILQIAVNEFAANISTQITVLYLEADSVRAQVDLLVKHAEETGADLVVLSTHARKGLDRFFLGSFAETLLIQCPIPVLITKQGTPWEPVFDTILFATDFGEGASEAFDSVRSVAKEIEGSVVLFHRLDPERVLVPPPGFLAVEEWKNRKAARQAQARQFQLRAEEQGVRVEMEIDFENHSVVSAILNAEERLRVGLIAIGCRKASAFSAMGSIPRQVVRSAASPVLVFPIQNPSESRR